jgi:hypothetical protein
MAIGDQPGQGWPGHYHRSRLGSGRVAGGRRLQDATGRFGACRAAVGVPAAGALACCRAFLRGSKDASPIISSGQASLDQPHRLLLEFEHIARPCCPRHVVLPVWIESHGKGYVSRGKINLRLNYVPSITPGQPGQVILVSVSGWEGKRISQNASSS